MTALIEHDGIGFACEIAGAGPTLVLLHGLGGDRAGALELTPTDLPRRRFAPDQRGHGETDPVGPESAFTFDTLATDLAALLDGVGHEGPCVLAGVSMGAAVALCFALRYPERVAGLAFVRPAWTHERLTPNLVPNVEVARLLRAMPPVEALATYRASPDYARIAAVSAHAAGTLSSLFLQPRAAERAVRLDRLPRSVPYRAPGELAAVRVPTLVVGCERDPLHPVEFAHTWATLIPGAGLEFVASIADDVPQHRAEVRAAVARFLERLSAAPA